VAEQRNQPAVPRPAATVMLLREGRDGIEVLAIRRHEKLAFMGGMWVFPGGSVCAADAAAEAFARIPGPSQSGCPRLATLQGEPIDQHACLALAVAACRETFEETGVLLASDAAGNQCGSDFVARLQDKRRDIASQPELFAELLRAENLFLRVERLVYWAHWITPSVVPRRFDTRFFLARAPEGQVAVHDGVELVEARWMRPADALAEAKRGTIEIANATTATLRVLAQRESVDDALAAARATVEIERHRPCVAQGSGGARTFHRDDAAYHEIHWSDPAETMQTTYDLAPGVPKRLDAHVVRIIAPNGGAMTGPGTNSYFIGERDLALIDPGPLDDGHVATLLAYGAGRIRWILCTHAHRDHSPAAAAIAAATGAQVIGMPAPAGPRQDPTFAPRRVVRDGERLTLGASSLTAIHTPGHASNHVCWMLAATAMLFTGDHVMQGTTVVIPPPDGNMRQYLASLERLLALDVAIIAPGHGYLIGRPHREVRRLIAHRRWREARVLDAVTRLGPASVADLVDDVYPEVPERLRAPAARTLEAHLIKLVEDRKVSERAGRFRVLAE
jgi:glyoxylase-like metal-dependent hydrolase (beta-lactamase superfamily II)/8-oxo-dGTP pyrophosphatase MutT (NUDIX family)